ncbi:hypothetical protein [Priestia endophytica]|uniref:hypothetical protein n=1 Tax=Priestia endophytica TaxID=135735 RepID=UPI000F54A669|nr:hypothetical protein [Priestia endophytica]RPK12881.1 hypothetical protein FH5_03087 [Priestia endophytica]
MNYEGLLKAYLSLWNNRHLSSYKEAEEKLKELIKEDLSSAWSHPRIRKSKEVQLTTALTRIEQSSLESETKQALKALYEQIYDAIE